MRITESWRLKAERYTLQGTINCENNEVNFPPRAVQPREVELYDFSHTKEDSYVWATEKAYVEAK